MTFSIFANVRSSYNGCLYSTEDLRNNISNTKSNVPLNSHKSPKMCLICYSYFLKPHKTIDVQRLESRYKESPPLLLHSGT